MKRILVVVLSAAAVLGLGAFAINYVPPPVGAYTLSGGNWNPAASSLSAGALNYIPPAAALYCYNSGTSKWVPADSSCFGGGGSMVYPGAGIPNSTGSAWGTSYSTTGTGNVVLSANPTFGGNGAASTPGVLANGSVFTGGTATTTLPYWFLQPSGATAATTWVTGGTMLGFNAASGFAGNIIDAHINGGSSIFSVGSAGQLVSQTVAGISSMGLTSNTVGLATSAFRASNGSAFMFSSTSTYSGTADAGFDRAAANVIETNCGTTGTNCGLLRKGSYTVATLPACNGTTTKGAEASVTDATAPTYLGTLTGGGSVVTPVICNGSAWVSY